MGEQLLHLEISRVEKRGKHSHKETHRPPVAGNVGGPRRTVPPQDNVNIRLGFVIGNYFSLLRSLFSDVIPVWRCSRGFPEESSNVPAAAPYSQSLRAKLPPPRLVSSATWKPLLTRNVRPIFGAEFLVTAGRRENLGSGFYTGSYFTLGFLR